MVLKNLEEVEEERTLEFDGEKGRRGLCYC